MAEMRTVEMVVTPEMAKTWLERNTRNRTLKRYNLEALKNDILHGKWEVTHQGIAIAEDGELVDGAHRLTAVAQTNIPCRMLVTFNAPRSANIDTGSKRTMSDQLYMGGYVDRKSIERSNLVSGLLGCIIDRGSTVENAKTLKRSSIFKHNLFLSLKGDIDQIVYLANSGKDSIKIKGARSSPLMYGMLCAKKSGISINTLCQWYKILCTGDFYVENDDHMTKCGRSILLLRNTMSKISVSYPEDVNNLIEKTESSIRHYSNRNPITRLYGELCFPEISFNEDEIWNYEEQLTMDE